MPPEPDYLVDAPTAAAYVAHLRQRPCAPGTIWSWATRGHIHRTSRGRYDIREIDAHTRKVLMQELLEWLRAQLDAQLRDADLIHEVTCMAVESTGSLCAVTPELCTCGQPAQVRAEVDAKRRLLELHAPREREVLDEDDRNPVCSECFTPDRGGELAAAAWPCRTVRLQVLPYASRPGYLDAWRPDEAG